MGEQKDTECHVMGSRIAKVLLPRRSEGFPGDRAKLTVERVEEKTKVGWVFAHRPSTVIYYKYNKQTIIHDVQERLRSLPYDERGTERKPSHRDEARILRVSLREPLVGLIHTGAL
jgi:hypothetical protein